MSAPLTKKNRVKFSFIDDRELAAREVFLREMEVLVKEYRDTMASPKTQEKLMADQKKVHSAITTLGDGDHFILHCHLYILIGAMETFRGTQNITPDMGEVLGPVVCPQYVCLMCCSFVRWGRGEGFDVLQVDDKKKEKRSSKYAGLEREAERQNDHYMDDQKQEVEVRHKPLSKQVCIESHAGVCRYWDGCIRLWGWAWVREETPTPCLNSCGRVRRRKVREMSLANSFVICAGQPRAI